jgi:hypothetical protein
MWLEITYTTDGKFIGRRFEASARPVPLSPDRCFMPDRVFPIGAGLWRLASANYIIDTKEVNDHA